ncbi:MjaI family restriction endonuclease [uncultured Muribaculum sp.]|uniref:MjaI family restriction endonuclease n=1 Tax=uncultured Muribaculum sp. TaxID=1918613 RepID=UPI0027314E8C|nr:MjaI family restriction endonuclease [uncultured Muribaculum sp.]
MKKIKISNSDIEKLSNASQYPFPKYATQIINLLNSNAQGTRPAVVGQMSELIQEFDGKTLEEWIEWYSSKQPDAVTKATDKIFNMYQLMSEAFAAIDRPMIEAWVKDLVYNKTYCGLKFQSAIIAFLAGQYNKDWRLANVEEEARGIDGFVGDTPVQIKSSTYKLEARLGENIEIPIVYYDKKKDGISIEFDPSLFS